MTYNFLQKNKGFTLVETLVAVAIFATSILGLLSLLSSSISNTTYAKEKIIAGYLAEEGIEYMVNLRSTYVLYSATGQTGWDNFNIKVAGNTFPNGNSICSLANKGCYFDDASLWNSFQIPEDMAHNITNLTINTCANSTCSTNPLLYDSVLGKYTYTSSGTTTNSGFTRQIIVKQISADEINILSTVYWKQGSGNFSVSLSDNLSNWVQ